MNELSEILRAVIDQRSLHRQQSRFPKTVKLIIKGVFQMIGIMITLIGVNVITTKLESFMVNQPTFIVNITEPLNFKVTPSPKMSENEYGCNRNLCWRTCDDGDSSFKNEQDKQRWCYTSSELNSATYQACAHSYECSLYSTCLSPCKLSPAI